MEITGRIIQVLEPRRGTAARTGNPWVCGQYVLETEETYPKKVFFEVFGEDRINQFNIQNGERLEVSIDIDAREYNGRWFNSVRAFRVNRNIQPAQQPGQMPANVPPFDAAPMSQAPFAAPGAAPAQQAPADKSDDLPF